MVGRGAVALTLAPEPGLSARRARALDQQLYDDFQALRRERAITDGELSAWAAELTAERLAAPLVYTRRGQPRSAPLWWSVAHLFNHQTHHRGQITTLLAQRGCGPGVTDLVAMLRQEAARAGEQR